MRVGDMVSWSRHVVKRDQSMVSEHVQKSTIDTTLAMAGATYADSIQVGRPFSVLSPLSSRFVLVKVVALYFCDLSSGAISDIRLLELEFEER